MKREVKDFLRLQADLYLARQDFTAGLLAKGFLDRAIPAGDEGRGVITMPGFGAPEATLGRLNKFLNRSGFVAESYNSGIPKGVTLATFLEETVNQTLGPRIEKLADKTGRRVALVGQSAGGLYAREFARRNPDHVDRVITLGSPTFHPVGEKHSNRALTYLVTRMSGVSSKEEMSGNDALLHWDEFEPEIPYVAIFSPLDGAVSEPETAIPTDIVVRANGKAPRENIRVASSHFGMSFNPFSLLAVADRLLQDREDWNYFDPYQYFSESMKLFVPIAFPPLKKEFPRPELSDLENIQALERARNAAEEPRVRVAKTLRTDHRNMSVLLDAMDAQLQSDSPPDYQLVYDSLHYLRTYVDVVHHPREDLLFERAVKRVPRVAEDVAILLKQHESLESRAASLLKRVEKKANSKSKRRNQSLEQACRAYFDSLREHMAFEETYVFAPSGRALREGDWDSIDAGIDYIDDPLFGKVRKRYTELSVHLDDLVEVVSDEATLLGFLEFEAFVEGVQAMGEGAGKLRSILTERSREIMDHNRQAVKKATSSRSLGDIARFNTQAAKGNVRLLWSCVSDVAGILKETGQQVTSPYFKRGRAFTEALRNDWRKD